MHSQKCYGRWKGAGSPEIGMSIGSILIHGNDTWKIWETDLSCFAVSVLCMERKLFGGSIMHVFSHPLNEMRNKLWNTGCVVNKNKKHACKTCQRWMFFHCM